MNITEKHIIDLLRTYGANPKRWPDTVREPAQKWLKDNPVSQKIADAKLKEETLDGFLNLNTPPHADTSFLQARILKAAQNQPQVPALNASFSTPANDQINAVQHKTKRAKSWGKSTLLSIKSIAATLFVTTGLGFGIGSSLGAGSMASVANSELNDVEYMLAASLLSDYDQDDFTDLTSLYLTSPNISPNGDGL